MQIQKAKRTTPKIFPRKMQKIIRYRAAVAVFQKWLEAGIIMREEFLKIDAAIADKCKLPPNSIYRTYERV